MTSSNQRLGYTYDNPASRSDLSPPIRTRSDMKTRRRVTTKTIQAEHQKILAPHNAPRRTTASTAHHGLQRHSLLPRRRLFLLYLTPCLCVRSQHCLFSSCVACAACENVSRRLVRIGGVLSENSRFNRSSLLFLIMERFEQPWYLGS